MANTIVLRIGSTDDWGTDNPVLSDAEIGVDLSTGLIKYGDGSTAWNSLSYSSDTLSDFLNIVGGNSSFTVATKTTLTIDVSEASAFIVTLSANTSFNLSNITAGLKTFVIINSHTATIEITIPNTSGNVFSDAVVSIGSGYAREVSLMSDGTTNYWTASKQMSIGV